MENKIQKLILAMFLVLTMFSLISAVDNSNGTAVDGMKVYHCGTITNVGYYTLNQSFDETGMGTGGCITISNSIVGGNVILDLNGFTISESSTTAVYGVWLGSRASTTIINGTISNYGYNIESDCWDENSKGYAYNMTLSNGEVGYWAIGQCKQTVENVIIKNSTRGAIEDSGTTSSTYKNINITTNFDSDNDGVIDIDNNYAPGGSTYTNILINSNATYVIGLHGGSSDVTFINATYNSSRELLGAGDILTRKWYFEAIVNNGTDNIEAAEVNITNILSSNVFSGLTDINGTISIQTLIEYISNGSNRDYYSPYSLLVEKSGYNQNLTTYNLTQTNNVYANITLYQLEVPVINITYPLSTTYDFTWNDTTNVDSLNYTVDRSGSCWYSIDGGLSNSDPVASGINFTDLSATTGSNIWTVYCNNSDGNIGSDSRTFIKSVGPGQDIYRNRIVGASNINLMKYVIIVIAALIYLMIAAVIINLGIKRWEYIEMEQLGGLLFALIIAGVFIGLITKIFYSMIW